MDLDHILLQFFCKSYVKRIVSLSVQNLLFCSWFRVCSWFASTGICANANWIVITPKEQTGAESIVYSAGTVTGVVLLQNLVLKTKLLRSRPSIQLDKRTFMVHISSLAETARYCLIQSIYVSTLHSRRFECVVVASDLFIPCILRRTCRW